MFRRRKVLSLYYVLLDKSTNSVKIYTTKQGAIDYMGTYRNNINRNMNVNGVYEDSNYVLWSRIKINKCKKGNR